MQHDGELTISVRHIHPLTHVTLTSQLDCEGMSINAADVLLEAQQLPAPQDLRYAVFHIGAAQHAPALVKNDVAELRVKMHFE